MFSGSWKTTLFGVLGAIAFIVGAVAADLVKVEDPLTWGLVAASVLNAIKSYFTRDDDRSSEDVGAA